MLIVICCMHRIFSIPVAIIFSVNSSNLENEDRFKELVFSMITQHKLPINGMLRRCMFLVVKFLNFTP